MHSPASGEHPNLSLVANMPQPSLSLDNGSHKDDSNDCNNSKHASNILTSNNQRLVDIDPNLKNIQASFRKLFASPVVVNVRAAAHSILVEHHPNHHVVNVYPYEFDLEEFAAAGHASLEIDYSPQSVDAGRSYKAGFGGRTYGSQAELKEKIYWARAKYTWQNHEFLLFLTSWKVGYDQEVYWQFLLDPCSSGSVTETKSERIDSLLLAVGQYSEEPHNDIFVFDDQYTYRDRDMYRSIQDAHWDDVIIDPAVKKGIMNDIVSFFAPATKELYLRYNLPYKRGIILHGSPGNGKTITIKALINHVQKLADPIPTLYVKSMKDKCKGDQESLKALFKDARRRAPLLLVLEDLDSLVHGDIRSHFLNEIDGLQSMDGILILGSTNHLSNIDSAISSRPSRFDRKYAFELPDRAGRERYARYWQRKLADNPDVDISEELCIAVADLTPGFSFAYLKELFISSLLIASRGGGVGESDGEAVQEKAVVVDQDKDTDTKPKPADDVENEAIKDQKPAGESKLIKMPEVVTSEALKANTFFTIVQNQAKVLIKDMNDAVVKEEEKTKKDTKSNDNAPCCSKC